LKVVDARFLKPFRLFGEVDGKIVFTSENVMFLFVEVPPRGVVPMHSHRHEQMGICLKGKAEINSETEKATSWKACFTDSDSTKNTASSHCLTNQACS